MAGICSQHAGWERGKKGRMGTASKLAKVFSFFHAAGKSFLFSAKLDFSSRQSRSGKFSAAHAHPHRRFTHVITMVCRKCLGLQAMQRASRTQTYSLLVKIATSKNVSCAFAGLLSFSSSSDEIRFSFKFLWCFGNGKKKRRRIKYRHNIVSCLIVAHPKDIDTEKNAPTSSQLLLCLSVFLPSSLLLSSLFNYMKNSEQVRGKSNWVNLSRKVFHFPLDFANLQYKFAQLKTSSENLQPT